MKKINCLAIESTAHTFGAGIVTEKGEILSDVRDMYQTKSGGIIPSEAAKHHKEISLRVINQALEEAKLNFKDINLISFSQGPGLAPCLLEGIKISKELAKKYKIRLIGVNHIIAHLEIGRLLCKVKDPVYVLATGANTQIIFFEGGRYRIGGETLDVGLGNALDKFGREIGLGFPSGSKIEALAKNGKYTKLPYVVKGMDLSFSGIITESIKKYKLGVKIEDLCYSLQETCFAMLTEVTERALAHTDKNEVLLIGGVAANKRLIEMLNIMCKERNAKFYAVPLKYSGDQAIMVGWQGILEFNSRKLIPIEKLDIKPRQRIDEIDVTWI